MSRRSVKQIAAGLALGAAAAGAAAATYVYVSNADSQDISVLQLDRANGALTAIETLKVGGKVMPMAVSPDKQRAVRRLALAAVSRRQLRHRSAPAAS